MTYQKIWTRKHYDTAEFDADVNGLMADGWVIISTHFNILPDGQDVYVAVMGLPKGVEG